MKYLILLLMLMLSGCNFPDMVASTDDGSSIIAVGTLANANDPYDMASAPVITKTTIIRISTTRALERHRITTEQARFMLGCTDDTINAVNAAYSNKSINGIINASKLADNCRTNLDKFKGTSQ
jgi:hypothetical protein